MNYLKRIAEMAVLEAQELTSALTKAEAQYIIIGTEDGWLEYNEKLYKEAKRML